MFKKLVQMGIQKVRGKGKVSPTIKSVKPTKDISGSVKRVYSEGYTKNIRDLDKAEGKIKTGKEMMKEGQKARKKMIDTGRAFQFQSRKTTHPIEPGEKPKVQYKTTIAKDRPQKKFKKGKELDREKKMGGGMMGRRMGYSQGKLAETPREKKLAAQYGDKKRITRGDIITIAKKKSGEEPMRDRMKQPLKRKKP
jgi:hypothetical protein